MRVIFLVAVAGILHLTLTGAANAQESPPDAPSDLRAETPFDMPIIYLFWHDNAGNEDSYQVERSADGPNGSWTAVGEASNECPLPEPHQCAYVDRDLVPETTYWYRVAAQNAAGMSAYSNVASASTGAEPTPAPDEIRGTVYHDRNANGVRDADEEGLSRRSITLQDGGVVLDRVITDDYGGYVLSNVPAGSHRMVADLAQTFPPSCGTYAFSYNPFEQIYPCQAEGISFPWDATTPIEVDLSADEGARVNFGAQPADVAVIAGTAIAETDYAPAGVSIEALFNGEECGNASVGAGHDFSIDMLGAGERPGCPQAGDLVQFTIDGVPASEMLSYRAFSSSLGQLAFLNLSAMQQHAWYWFQVSGSDMPANGTLVQAVIDGAVCGEARVEALPGTSIAGFLKLLVPSAELQPGCGRTGSMVSFLFNAVPTGDPMEWRPGLQYINPFAQPVPTDFGLPATGEASNARGARELSVLSATTLAGTLLLCLGLAGARRHAMAATCGRAGPSAALRTGSAEATPLRRSCERSRTCL